MMKKIIKNKYEYINTNKNKGFTLIETLVALSIFVVSVLVMISVSAGGINSTNVAKQKTVATFLANEGLEYVRNFRDTYSLGGGVTTTTSDWNYFSNMIVSKCGDAVGGCVVGPHRDFTDATTINDCSNGLCPKLFLDSINGYYDYSNNNNDPQTMYIRTIKVDFVDPNNLDVLKVTSNVIWGPNANEYNVTVSEYLYNWYKN